MVAARARFLAAGHYAPLSDALAAAARPGLVLDLAGGTGHHLAAVLDAVLDADRDAALGTQPTASGLVLDTSIAALRRAARAHPRMAAVGADAWSRLPLGDGVATTVLSVFGPRDPAEIARVLVPGGVVMVAGPRPDHLHELRKALPLLGISPDRDERLDAAFAAFTPTARATVRFPMTLDRQAVTDLVGMGPSARHLPDLDERVAGLPPELVVTAAVEVVTYAVKKVTAEPIV
jgi:SAM-dependent methyltransferase